MIDCNSCRSVEKRLMLIVMGLMGKRKILAENGVQRAIMIMGLGSIIRV